MTQSQKHQALMLEMCKSGLCTLEMYKRGLEETCRSGVSIGDTRLKCKNTKHTCLKCTKEVGGDYKDTQEYTQN